MADSTTPSPELAATARAAAEAARLARSQPAPTVTPVVPQAAPTITGGVPVDESLPPYWDTGGMDVMGRVEGMDPEYAFYWVKTSAHNQQLKRYQGWEPLEFDRSSQADMARLARYGFDVALLNAKGRIQWMDTEVWRMTRRRNQMIRRSINDRLANKSASVRATLDAQAEEIAGRSRNRVIPFVSSGTPGEDVFDRTQVSESSARAGKSR